ncbi:MAG: hypothetical protein K0S85_82 [Pseudomonas orientalis]|nr:hypothetical protein [Pseudomonas orientalis]
MQQAYEVSTQRAMGAGIQPILPKVSSKAIHLKTFIGGGRACLFWSAAEKQASGRGRGAKRHISPGLFRFKMGCLSTLAEALCHAQNQFPGLLFACWC